MLARRFQFLVVGAAGRDLVKPYPLAKDLLTPVLRVVTPRPALDEPARRGCPDLRRALRPCLRAAKNRSRAATNSSTWRPKGIRYLFTPGPPGPRASGKPPKNRPVRHSLVSSTSSRAACLAQHRWIVAFGIKHRQGLMPCGGDLRLVGGDESYRDADHLPQPPGG